MFKLDNRVKEISICEQENISAYSNPLPRRQKALQENLREYFGAECKFSSASRARIQIPKKWLLQRIIIKKKILDYIDLYGFEEK
jgi:hypothetical protein